MVQTRKCSLVVFNDISDQFIHEKYQKEKLEKSYLSSLSSIVNHQIALPIETSVSMALQLVQDPETGLKMRKSLIKLSSCLKMSSLIANQLQDNCQISLNNLQPREKVATIAVLVKEVNVMFTAKLKKKNLVLNSSISNKVSKIKY